MEIYFSKKKNNNNTNKSYQSILDLAKINIDVWKLWFWLNKKYERDLIIVIKKK